MEDALINPLNYTLAAKKELEENDYRGPFLIHCPKCKVDKSVKDFYKDKTTKSGLCSHCIDCKKAYKKRHNKTKAAKESRARCKARILENDPDYFNRWQRENRDKCNEYEKTYRSKNPEHFKIKNGKRRAVVRSIEARSFSSEDLRIFWIGQNINPDKCYYCVSGPHQEIDHYIPISKGGAHLPVNLRPSCKECNRRKSNKHPIDFMKENK